MGEGGRGKERSLGEKAADGQQRGNEECIVSFSTENGTVSFEEETSEK